MNWISSQSEQELRISMNKLGEGREGDSRGWRELGQCQGNSRTHLPEPHLQDRAVIYPTYLSELLLESNQVCKRAVQTLNAKC